MAVTAGAVKDLREKTGAGMMDCKKALEETNGDFEKAVEYLRKKGVADASKRSARIAAEGAVASYIHMGGRLGVLVEVNCESDFVARGDSFREFIKGLSMHVAASRPGWLRREDVPIEIQEKEKEIYRARALEEGKPEAVLERIVLGRLDKFYKEFCLLEQPWVLETEKSVLQVLNELIAKTGEKVSIRRFIRWELGEGLEKRSHDLAAEVKAQLGQ